MQDFMYYLTIVSVIAVLIVLAMGLRTMLQAKSPNLSQKLMRWRVALQFFAILVLIGYALIKYSSVGA